MQERFLYALVTLLTPSEIWQRLGGDGVMPSRSGCYGGDLLILGGGRCVWDDINASLPWEGQVMAVNDIGMHYRGRIQHWVTMHAKFMQGWMHYRQNHSWGWGDKPVTHAHTDDMNIDCVWPLKNWAGGTSGLFACYVALMLGYSNIVLAGMPLTQDGRYLDAPFYGGEFTDPLAHWEWARDNVFDGRVKSLSGRSKELLG